MNIFSSKSLKRARRNGSPDPLDAHLDKVFSNLDDKNGQDGSLWDRIKRNFVDENVSLIFFDHF